MSATVLLVEDHDLLAESLAAALGARGITARRPPSRDADAVLAAVRDEQPDVVLLDLVLDDDVSALPLVAPIVAAGSVVVMCTGETDQARLAECVEAGAIGVVPKSASFEHLVASLEEAVHLGTLLDRAQRDDLLAELRRQRAEDAARRAPFEALTRGEREVLGGLVAGLSADAIAEARFVSVATVRSQIRAVLTKLGVRSQLAAVAKATAAGWTPDGDP